MNYLAYKKDWTGSVTLRGGGGGTAKPLPWDAANGQYRPTCCGRSRETAKKRVG